MCPSSKLVMQAAHSLMAAQQALQEMVLTDVNGCAGNHHASRMLSTVCDAVLAERPACKKGPARHDVTCVSFIAA